MDDTTDASERHRSRRRQALTAAVVAGLAATTFALPAPAGADVGDGGEPFAIGTDDPDVSPLNEPHSATLADGSVVVAWSAADNTFAPPTDPTVRAQRFSASGTPLGASFRVESTVAGNQQTPVLTPLASGGFLAVFTSNDGVDPLTSGHGIRARAFTPEGVPTGPDVIVNTTTRGPRTEPAAATLADGQVVVAYRYEEADGSIGVRARLLAADGTPTGEDFAVNAISTGLQVSPSIGALDDGGFVIAWFSNDATGPDTDDWGIRATRYDATGAVVGTPDLQVNSTTAGAQRNPDVVGVPGGFAVAYSSNDGATGNDIRARFFDLDGTPAGDDFVVNTALAGNQGFPVASTLGDGRVVVSWIQNDAASGAFGIRSRVVAATGPTGDEVVVTSRAVAPSNVHVSLVDGTTALATWREAGADIGVWGRLVEVSSTVPVGPGPDSKAQTLTVEVPEPGPGEFAWSIDGTGPIDLGTPANAGDHWAFTGNIHPIVVTDTRTGGQPWSLSGQVGDFTGGLAGKHLGWTPQVTSPGAGATPGDPVASGFTGGNGLTVASTLAAADTGHDQGTATLGAHLDLQVPIATPPGTYTTTLTLTALS
ncbi:MAG: hypothetical protein AB7L84_12615 [Acidimicrobiia bacterium]